MPSRLWGRAGDGREAPVVWRLCSQLHAYPGLMEGDITLARLGCSHGKDDATYGRIANTHL